MAQKVVLIDDVDGSEGNETVHFALDSQAYEIDLSEVNAKDFRSGLALYVEKARQVERKPVPVSSRELPSRRRSGTAGRGPGDLAQIRAWAETKGLTVSSRGRIKKEILDQYDAEHSCPPRPAQFSGPNLPS